MFQSPTIFYLFIFFFRNTDLSKVLIPTILYSSIKLILMTYFNLLNFYFFKQLDGTMYKLHFEFILVTLITIFLNVEKSILIN